MPFSHRRKPLFDLIGDKEKEDRGYSKSEERASDSENGPTPLATTLPAMKVPPQRKAVTNSFIYMTTLLLSLISSQCLKISMAGQTTTDRKINPVINEKIRWLPPSIRFQTANFLGFWCQVSEIIALNTDT